MVQESKSNFYNDSNLKNIFLICFMNQPSFILLMTTHSLISLYQISLTNLYKNLFLKILASMTINKLFKAISHWLHLIIIFINHFPLLYTIYFNIYL